MSFLLVLSVFMQHCFAEDATASDIFRITDGDYLGCYALGCLQFDYNTDHLDNHTTPDSCTATCKENGFPWAEVYNGTKCSCACVQSCLTESVDMLDDTKCGLPCRSAPTKLCGGYTAASVYSVHQPVKANEKFCKLEERKENTSDSSFPRPVVGPSVYIALIDITFFVVIVVLIILIRRRSRSPARPLGPRLQSTNSNETPRKTSNEHLDHLYADHQCSGVLREPQGQTPSCQPQDEYHEYTYADQLTPKLETSELAVANDEDGYIILDEPSLSPSSQVVYYSSAIPKGPGKGLDLSSQSPSPSLYYSSRIHKPEGK